MKNCYSLPLLTLCLLLTSCGKEVSDGSAVSDINNAEKIARATQTLRLGQTTSSNSAVAVSAAIDNFESFITLGRTRIEHVLYTTSDGSIVRVSLDELLRPSAVQTKDTSLTFGNYTGSTVDVTSNGATATVALDSAGNLKSTTIPSSSFKAVTLLSTSELLDASARAIRSFGCVSNQAANQLAVSTQFASVALSSCRSLLVDAVRVRLDRNEADQIPISQELSEPTTCDSDQDGWADDFSKAQSCAARVGTQLVKEVIKENPTVDSEINPDFKPEDNLDDEFDGDVDSVLDEEEPIDDNNDNGNTDGEDPDSEEPTVPDDGGETPDDGSEIPDDGGETPDDGGEDPDGGEETPPDLPKPPLPGQPQPGTPGKNNAATL